MKTPLELGYQIPCEWTPTKKVWLTWPSEGGLWPDVSRESLEQAFSALAQVIARFAEVGICVAERDVQRVERLVPTASLLITENDDVWCRDHGPTFLKNSKTGAVAAVDWVYNGWGGKYPFEKDAQIARRIVKHEGLPCFSSSLVCEGGALESNGVGTILTTESVLLNLNRNANWSREEIERELKVMSGVERVVWLPGGLEKDDTDGHIDMVARFLSENLVLALEPVTETLQNNWRRLEEAGFEVKALPFAGEITPGVEGSYANFLIVNNGILVPQYGLPSDAEVLNLVASLSEKEVVGVDCRLFGLEGGGLHCLTQGQWMAIKA